MTRAERRQAVLSLAETRQAEYEVRRAARKAERNKSRSARAVSGRDKLAHQRAQRIVGSLKGRRRMRLLRKFGEIA